jgi:hypothetical protein
MRQGPLNFFLKIKVSAHYERFYSYVSEKVYLIINLLDSDLKSEKIFVNVNKGVKLNDEDLVKAAGRKPGKWKCKKGPAGNRSEAEHHEYHV